MKARLALESLDARIVPATYWWQGWESTDPADPDNRGPPDGGPALPGIGDSLEFGPEVWTDPVTGLSRDCIGLSSPGGSFASIRIGNGYTGSVELDGPVEAGDFYLSGGAISQPTSGDDLTVTNYFEWTGGTLNSSTNLANLTITGSTATGLIAPTGGGTVNLGSSINLSNGAVATLREGTINITNDGTEFNINANSEMWPDPGPDKEVTIEANNFGGQINLDAATSVLDIKSGRVNSTGSVKNTAGRFTLRSGALAAFTGEVDKEANGPSFRQIGGIVQLYLDSALTMSNSGQAFLMSGGTLSIMLDTGSEPAEIVGHVKITGGEIISGANTSGDNHLFGELRIEGNLHWLGGTYRPFVSAGFEEAADLWYVTGTITIEGTAAIAPTAVDGENNVVSPPPDMAWFVFRSDTNITNANGTPSISAGWAIEKDPATPPKWWKVKAA